MSKENRQGGQRGKGGKKKSSSRKYYTWDLTRIMEETRILEMQSLLYESDEAFRELTQAKETRPEDLDCEKAE